MASITILVDTNAGGGGAVDSVNGQTGTVVLTNTDVGAAATVHTHEGTAILSTGQATGKVLTSDGSNGAAWQTAGGGVVNFDDKAYTASPNNTRNVSALEAKGSTADVDAVLKPKGNGAILAHVPDGTATGGDKRGLKAVDLQVERGLASQVASGNYAVILGGGRNAAGGSYSLAAGYASSAMGMDSVAVGEGNAASGQGSMTIGASNTVSGGYSVVLGLNNTATANYAFLLGKNNNSGSYGSVVLGSYGMGRGGGDEIVFGLPAGDTSVGSRQMRFLGMRRGTIDDTPLVLMLSNSFTYLPIASYTAMAFRIHVVGKSSAANNEIVAFELRGAAYRHNTAASTTVGSVTKDVLLRTTPTLDCAVSADTTNGGLIITVTGHPSKTITWHATIELSELVLTN